MKSYPKHEPEDANDVNEIGQVKVCRNSSMEYMCSRDKWMSAP